MTTQNEEKKPYDRKIGVVTEDEVKVSEKEPMSAEAKKLKEGIMLMMATGRAVKETDAGNWKVVSDEELAERERCADNHLCQRCKKPLKGEWQGEDYHTPYWIPRIHWYFWCTECWNKDPSNTHTWCPHNKDPHRLDEYYEANRRSNEAISRSRDGINIPVHIDKKVSE